MQTKTIFANDMSVACITSLKCTIVAVDMGCHLNDDNPITYHLPVNILHATAIPIATFPSVELPDTRHQFLPMEY